MSKPTAPEIIGMPTAESRISIRLPSPLFRHKMRAYHNRPCPYCKRSMIIDDVELAPTKDHHPIPRSRGGHKTIVACTSCNNHKSDMDATEWATYMAANPEWWLLSREARRELNPRRGTHREASLAARQMVANKPEKSASPFKIALQNHAFVRKIAREFTSTFGTNKKAGHNGPAE